MDPQVSTSFIPKKPLADTRSAGGGAYGLIFLIAILFFITSLLAAGGAFLYVRYLSVSLDAKKVSLQKYQEAYDLPTIQTLVRFDSRINESQKILQKHLSPSAIFFFLSDQTLEKVRFKDFSYSLSSTEHSVNISMTGITDSFATVALQSDKLGSSKSLRDIIFSDISIEKDGKVGFSVSAKVDPALIYYGNNLNTEQPPSIPIEQTTTETEGATPTP
ncbi:MAG: hypothetical protein G01um101456_302 [Parcubacteria group bacterium Gr01-1014_56]|nr:MAG: hypothetical protein G01um101456_302 [Parcubacteria group bacterium Gr01-1014_56]